MKSCGSEGDFPQELKAFPTRPSMKKVIWHGIFGNLNYNRLCLLRKNVVYGFPTIPKHRNKCDACILGKHSKQPF